MRGLSFRGVPSMAIADGATSPSAPIGSLVWSTTTNSLLVWNGSMWRPLAVSGGGYPSIAWPKRLSTPKIVGDVAATALGTLALTAARQYFIPLVVPRSVTLSGLRISVTTASAGQANLGIYNNTVVSGSDSPGSLLAAVSSVVDVGTTGDKTGSFSSNVTLQAGTLYWASMISSSAATVRAVTAASIQTSLGRQVNNTGAITHLFAAGSGSTLPATAPTALTDGTSANPAIYLIEV